jgi:hypothetical protein
MLYWKQVWKHMHDLTEKEIEKRAVMEFICYFEELMNMVISQSIEELEKKNKFNEIQGLRQMERIDRDCIKNAIKSINNNNYSFVSEWTGGKSKKEIRKKHLQESTEVA